MAAVIAAVLASLPAGASAEVITPKVVKPKVVKPQAVTQPPASAPAPAPSSAPAPNRGSGSAPVRPSSPSAEPVDDTPDPGPAPGPRPRPVPPGEKPPLPTPPDYQREGFPTCIANSGDVEKRCKCDPAWCRFFSEQQAWDRWEKEHADDQTGEINAERQAATDADKATAAAADSIAAAVEKSIQAVIDVKEVIERASRPPTAEEKCKCSIGEGGDSSSDPPLDDGDNSSVLGPPEPGLGTAAREVADTVAEAAGGLSRLFQRLLAE